MSERFFKAQSETLSDSTQARAQSNHEGVPRRVFRSVSVSEGSSQDALRVALAQNAGFRAATFKELELAARNPSDYPELLEANVYGQDRKQRLWVFAFETRGRSLLKKGMFFKHGVWFPIWGPSPATDKSHWDAEVSRILLVEDTGTYHCACAKKKREGGLKRICACLNPVMSPQETCEACHGNSHRGWMSVT